MTLNWFSDQENVDTKLYYSSATKLWSEKGDAMDYIISNQKKYNKLVIIWHSLWADNAVELSNSLKDKWINVNLLLTIDLQAYIDTTKVKSNTLNAINYYQTHITSSANWDIITKSKWNNVTTIKNIKANNYCDIYDCFNGLIENEKLYHTNIDDFLYRKVTTDVNNIIKK